MNVRVPVKERRSISGTLKRLNLAIQRLWNLAIGNPVYQATAQEKQDAQGLSMIRGVIVKELRRDTGETVKRIVIIPLRLQHRAIEEIHRAQSPW